MGTDKNQNQQPPTRPSGRPVYPPPGHRRFRDPHWLERLDENND